MATSHITDFIQSLSSEEVKIVREYVYKSNSRPILGENKIEKLFDTLVKDPEKKFTDKELSGILESNAGALRVLKSRLFEKAKEAMMFDKHFENPLVFNEREQIVFTLKKQILFIKSLFRTLNQGRAETINILLAETIKVAQKYEAYDVLVESLIQQKQIKGVRLGFEEFKKINTQIKFYENCFKCIQDACDAFYKLILNQNLSNSLTKNELESHIKISIKKMETDYKITGAQEVNYFMHIFKIALCENEKNFLQAIVYCKKILALLKKSSVLYSRDRIGFAVGNLCMFNVFAERFNEAVIHAKNAQKLHINNSFNHLTMKEQEFYAQWYAGNYAEAIKCSREMLKHSMADAKGYHKSKFIFYEACVLFATKQFKEALQLLNKSLKIEKDKTGWNIAIRISMAMIFIELKKNDEANTCIGALRKHIERTQKIKERDILILKLLRELEKDGFQKNEKNKTAIKLLAELSDKNKPTAWNYYTPELIPFHEWVMSLPEKTSVPRTSTIKA